MQMVCVTERIFRFLPVPSYIQLFTESSGAFMLSENDLVVLKVDVGVVLGTILAHGGPWSSTRWTCTLFELRANPRIHCSIQEFPKGRHYENLYLT